MRGVVFAASMDGYLRAHSARDGKVLWEFNTAEPYVTVAGKQAYGGVIDVLVAFSVDGK